LLVFAGEVSANLSLASYLRDHLGLKGTKITCGQGGCGACVVTAEIFDHGQGNWVTKSINSVKHDFGL
jgi:aerobic-type carbon monoxide dehydrogenase small subunit (CoxS/CutS family)